MTLRVLVIFLYLAWFSFCLSLFWELRDNGDLKYLQFCPLSLGVILEFNISNVRNFLQQWLFTIGLFFCYQKLFNDPLSYKPSEIIPAMDVKFYHFFVSVTF